MNQFKLRMFFFKWENVEAKDEKRERIFFPLQIQKLGIEINSTSK